MDSILQDLRYAIRTLLKAPAFTVTAVITFALGIGANSTMFSIVNAVLLRPLPYPHPDQLVSAGFVGQYLSAQVPQTVFENWRANSTAFQALGAYTPLDADFVGGATPVHARGARVTANLAGILGVTPELGRSFRADEDRPGAPHVLLLSHGFWQSQFGADSSVVGRSVDLDGTPATVVGVLPPALDFPRHAQFWTPLVIAPSRFPGVIYYLFAVGRLRRGVSPTQAGAELTGLSRTVRGPTFLRDAKLNLVTLHERLFGSARPLLLVLLGAVGLTLLAACVNVANLSLVRATAREREFAIRVALGAGRTRVARQVLVESLCLALLGGAAGLLVPIWSIGVFARLSPADLLRGQPVGVDPAVLVFTLVVAVGTGLVFGLVPALGAGGAGLGETLKAGVPVGPSGRGSKLRQVLVATELGAGVVLLVGAGLLSKSLYQFVSVDPGFQPQGLVGLSVNLPPSRYHDADARSLFYQRLLDRVSALPGVESAALAAAAPLEGISESRTLATDEVPSRGDGTTDAVINTVTERYFATAGISVIEGRPFGPADRGGAAPVCIVNRTFARRFFRGDPVGREVLMPGAHPDRVTVVGLVEDVRQNAGDVVVEPEVFFPASQEGWLPGSLLIRSGLDPNAVLNEARGVVSAIDPLQAVWRSYSFERELGDSVASRRFDAILLGLFAGLVLILGAVGIYGVTSYVVTQRGREIGIRIALGAERTDVAWMVLAQGARVIGIGLAIGVPAAFGFTRLLSSLLFRVSPTDLVTFLVVPPLLGGVALLTCYVPARRATRVDPVVALRTE